MTMLERLARYEHAIRPWLVRLPPPLATRVFSEGRTWFAHRLLQEQPSVRELVNNPVQAWNLTFRIPLWNAAGMFKDGRGYDVMGRQGAGAFVVGTTTAQPRSGNVRNGIRWPSAAYPNSRAASNWMGLPNPGHTAVATTVSRLQRVEGCPVGASVSADPGADEAVALRGLVSGMNAYSLAKVDYLELNESCPNVPGAHSASALDEGLIRRLEYVSAKFLATRHRPLPVVVKFSTDLDAAQLPTLLELLVSLNFDGVVLGNTSTQYAAHRHQIAAADRRLYDAFTTEYGGGVSGAPLKPRSLELCKLAMIELQRIKPPHQFHVIRCGGVFTSSDILASNECGVVLHQWYTGYFEAFARYGHDAYLRISRALSAVRNESSLAATRS